MRERIINMYENRGYLVETTDQGIHYNNDGCWYDVSWEEAEAIFTRRERELAEKAAQDKRANELIDLYNSKKEAIRASIPMIKDSFGDLDFDETSQEFITFKNFKCPASWEFDNFQDWESAVLKIIS